MRKYGVTTTDLETMNVSEFRRILEDYDEFYLTNSPYYLQSYMIKEKCNIFHFHEKFNLLVSQYQKKNNSELKDLLDSCCFHLDLELTEKLLQKGCKVDEKIYTIDCRAPLFRTFIYNYYFMEHEPLDTVKKKEMEQIGKLLIQHGALLEIDIKGYESGTTNFIGAAKENGREESILYLNECKDLFNPVQRQQWNKMRLYTVC